MRGAYMIFSTGEFSLGGGVVDAQLTKDCGLVPFLLQKNHGLHSTIVGVKHGDYPSLKYLPDVNLDFLPEDSTSARFEYIDNHAEDMDLLILYGAYTAYEGLVAYYKRKRPDGKIYLAADANLYWIDRLPITHPTYRGFIDSCDVIGASCEAMKNYLTAKWQRPIKLVRNGFYNFAGVDFDDTEKENTILTVGRIGTNQKQNHVLMAAFARVAKFIPNWNLRLVGGVEESFNPFIQRFFKERPDLRKRVSFAGFIKDKAKLMEEYKRAKIFCLTSTVEGCPNAAAEALWAGDYVITSSIDAAPDITANNLCGRIFSVGDIDGLAHILQNACRDENLLRYGAKAAKEYAQREFAANKVIADLFKELAPH